MSELPWKPWHQVVELREDLRSGDLSLSTFAADLYDVLMGKAKPIYQEPKEFFSLTYPTFNLRELAKDVIGRLAGVNDKAVLQLELTYGGGKTHSLITLYHLVTDPENLPDLPTIGEFLSHIGVDIPKTRVAVISFDKLDPVKGMDVKSPDGTVQRFLYPWSVLAFQLGGSEALKVLGMEGEEEREEPPFENVLVDLLQIPAQDGFSTLILIDEVLMWARTKVDTDPVWRHRLQDFFQALTQAVTKVDHSCIVASLLATDPEKYDELGKEVVNELYAIFRREREQGVSPVEKEDISEILRRRFFTSDSIRDHESFRSHVDAALAGIVALDGETKKRQKEAENLFLSNYPFHPNLIDVFYVKWTNVEGFQRTRGVLRTFALALRNAENWDTCPLVGANVLLNTPEAKEVSSATQELGSIASREEYRGKSQDWNTILAGELEKAREIQDNYPAINHREIEQAVIATFLHSQPIGRKAQTRDLLLLLGQTRPDRIELENGLRQWADLSWFLDETEVNKAEVGADGQKQLPHAWRLGSSPNLQQMHHDTRESVSPDLINTLLLEETRKLKTLTAGAAVAGVKVHLLPAGPKEVGDDGDFHFAILGPEAASSRNAPSPLAIRFIDETTSHERLRTYRNAIILAVPLIEGLEYARNQIRDYLGWEEVRVMLKVTDPNFRPAKKARKAAKGKKAVKQSSLPPEDQTLDSTRLRILLENLNSSREKIPEAIRQAYCVVVTVAESGDVQAFKLSLGEGALFDQIKADPRSRIQETAISAEALLPGGPYDLWREEEANRRVKTLVNSFAENPWLPKMLKSSAIAETIRAGCMSGHLVLQLPRPDRSLRTFWHEDITESDFTDPTLEVTLPEQATLANLFPSLLKPEVLPGLWDGEELQLSQILEYFSGTHVAKIQREGYEEPLPIPHAEQDVIISTIAEGVRAGDLWLVSGSTNVYHEDCPLDLITEEVILRKPPEKVTANDLLPPNLPEVWQGKSATALAIYEAFTNLKGLPLPWSVVRDALDKAINSGRVIMTPESPWPVDFSSADSAIFTLPKGKPPKPPVKPVKPAKPAPPGQIKYTAEGPISKDEIQDVADSIPEILGAAVGLDLKFKLGIELTGPESSTGDVVAKINEILAKIKDDLKLEP